MSTRMHLAKVIGECFMIVIGRHYVMVRITNHIFRLTSLSAAES